MLDRNMTYQQVYGDSPCRWKQDGKYYDGPGNEMTSEQVAMSSEAYIASKGGLKQLAKSLALDLGKYNIRVNNVGPGYIRTNMTKKGWSKNRKQIEEKTILGRWGTPEDLVGTVIFLLSSASAYITGQDIYVDGGWLAKGL